MLHREKRKGGRGGRRGPVICVGGTIDVAQMTLGFYHVMLANVR